MATKVSKFEPLNGKIDLYTEHALILSNDTIQATAQGLLEKRGDEQFVQHEFLKAE